MDLNLPFHYPPELLKLLSEAVPKLCKNKKDVLIFFQGAGISSTILSPYEKLFKFNKEEFKKYTVVQEILVKLNQSGDKGLRDRREVLKRVVEFQDFSVCWPEDQPVVRGLVAQIREVVNVKDTFSRINIEREKERKQRMDSENQKALLLQQKKQEFTEIKQSFYSLFGESNPYRRGKSVEGVLNRYFKYSDILISEAITLKGNHSEGIVEQIDGAVQINGQLFLVEMKWEQSTLGREKVASHIVRVYSRNMAGAIFISYSDYSEAAILDCKDALKDKTIVLCKLSEFVSILDNETSLKEMLEAKINAATIFRNPWLEYGTK